MSRPGARTRTRLVPALALSAAAAAGLVLLPAGLALCQNDTPAPPPSAKADDAKPQPEAVADEAATEKGTGEQKEEEEPVHIENADLMQYDPEKELYFLTGNVHFRHRDAHLYCDEAEYNEADDTARAVGHLKLVTPDSTVTGDLITADFDQEVAEVTGNVRLVTQRKKEAEAEEKPADEAEPANAGPEAEKPNDEADKEPKKLDEYREKLTTVTCERIRYWYEEKRALGTGNVVAVQEDKTCYADEATYLEDEDTLTLVGKPVRVVMENGNRFQTNKVVVDVEGDRIWTEGPFSGIFKREKKEESEAEPAGTGAEATAESGTGTPPEAPAPTE